MSPFLHLTGCAAGPARPPQREPPAGGKAFPMRRRSMTDPPAGMLRCPRNASRLSSGGDASWDKRPTNFIQNFDFESSQVEIVERKLDEAGENRIKRLRG